VERQAVRGVGALFLACFTDEQPALARTGLLADEQINLHEYAWVTLSDLDSLPDRIEPPQMQAVIAALLARG